MAEQQPAPHGVLVAIRDSGEAAPPLEPIRELYGDEAVAALVRDGLIVCWQALDGERVTFTARAIARDGPFAPAGLELAERVEYTAERRVVNGKAETRSVPDEEPYWVSGGTGWGVKLPGSRNKLTGEYRYGVVEPPEPGKWVTLKRPDLVPDRRPEPEHLVDVETHRPVRVFVGPKEPEPVVPKATGPRTLAGGIGADPWEPGLMIQIDPKLARGQASHRKRRKRGGPQRPW